MRNEEDEEHQRGHRGEGVHQLHLVRAALQARAGERIGLGADEHGVLPAERRGAGSAEAALQKLRNGGEKSGNKYNQCIIGMGIGRRHTYGRNDGSKPAAGHGADPKEGAGNQEGSD